MIRSHQLTAFLVLFILLMMQGCKEDQCLCEPVELTEEFLIPKSDSISLDSFLTTLMGPKPILGLTDTTIRYARFGVWDTTRTVTEFRKSSSGYVIEKLLFKKFASTKSGAIVSESRPCSNLQWRTVINSINNNCLFSQPFQHTNTSVLDASPISIDVYFPNHECGEDYHLIMRPYLKEKDPIRHIIDALFEAGINRPFGTHQIDPIVD